MNKLFLSIVLCMATVAAGAKLKLSTLIGDNMVLQQQSEVRLWGWAKSGASVSVQPSWSSNTVTKTVDKDGTWTVKLKTPKASHKEYSITIKCGSETVKLKDILIGEVWLASGQSNMEMPLKGFSGCNVENGVADAMNAQIESPYVRMFNVPKEQAYTPQDSCGGSWLTPEFKNALEYSATAYYFASSLSKALDVPVGIINCSYGGAHVESWQSKEQCMRYPDIKTDSTEVYAINHWDRPMLMYNAMFWPVHKYTLKGIIWYQGCSNIGHADVYAKRLSDMVRDWRYQMGLGDIPFYQVELAPYMYGKDENDLEGALLREAQMAAVDVIANCGIVSTNDLVYPHEVHNIHPCQKRKVGQRLSYLALNKAYEMSEVACYGPRYKKGSLRVEENRAIVGFETNNFGICRNFDLKGFEIAGEDRVFYPATAEFRWQTNEVTLTSEHVSMPFAVRYCFKDFQIGNMIGGYELPLFPFRTDRW